MRNPSRFLGAALGAMLLAACSTAPTKQDQGMVIGAIAGGILGNQVGGGSGRVLATIVGSAAGAARAKTLSKWPATYSTRTYLLSVSGGDLPPTSGHTSCSGTWTGWPRS